MKAFSTVFTLSAVSAGLAFLDIAAAATGGASYEAVAITP